MEKNILQDYYNECSRIRGLIIDRTCLLEKQIDDFICQSLVGVNNKKIDFIKELFIENDLMYGKKVKISVGILQSKFKTISAYEKKYKDLQSQLNKIGTTRNNFAHGVTDLPEKLNFTKYKIAVLHKQKKYHYTHNEISNHLKLIEKTILVFRSYFNWKRMKEEDIRP